MALTKVQLLDLFTEERQIQILLEKATKQRADAKQAAEAAYLAALNAAESDYTAATQAAESRLLDIRQMLNDQGAWTAPTK